MAHPRVDVHENHREHVQVPEADVSPMRSQGDDPNVTTATSTPSQHMQHETIVLTIHDGNGYVLPYSPWETTKTQIEEIYRLHYPGRLADAIKAGNFSLKTPEDNIILPSLWNEVVLPAATVHIWLSSDVLYVDYTADYPYDYDASGRRLDSRIQPIPSPISDWELRANNPVVESEHEDGSGSGGDDDDYELTSSEDENSLYLESSSGESEASESQTVAESLFAAVRQVNTPTDEDGNSLVFKVDTTFHEPWARDTANTNNASTKRDPQQPIGNTESIAIAKATSSQADGRTWLQLYILKGPRTTSVDPDDSIRWIHLRSSPLDFAAFKETCLGIPGLSKRLQELTRRTFDKVEKEKLKVSLDGMFIEPGTVLRADESEQSHPESVIFSCIPYFNLHVPLKQKPTTGLVNRFPSRTLMQSYYPYEPVQDRDAEQAYRKFGNEQRGALIHVPNIWMVNIGSNIVATCSQQALQDSFVQSIKLVPMDRSAATNSGSSREIRLSDWEDRKLLYTVQECQSYFQMEQRLKELRWFSSSRGEKGLQFSWKINGSQVKVTPVMWAGILQHKDSLFIDLTLLNDEDMDNNDHFPVLLPNTMVSEPFFQWPQKPGAGDTETKSIFSDKIRRSIRCLEVVEKAMVSEVLTSDDSYSAVEKTFTSTAYYRNQKQCTEEDVRSSLQALEARVIELNKPRAGTCTSHQAVVLHQKNIVAQKTSELHDSMHNTLALFVADVDKNTMLRKAWAAVHNIVAIATSTLQHEPTDEPVSAKEASPPVSSQKWCVRADLAGKTTSGPTQKLKTSFKKCRKCSGIATYSTSQAALAHAQKHFDHADAPCLPALSPEDCVIDLSQMSLEVMNRGLVDILTTACKKAQQLFTQARELSDGVMNADGQMSDLYTLPRSLLGAFRQVLVFYFAVERAMFYAGETYKKSDHASKRPDYKLVLPSSSSIQAIETFADGVQHALASARTELCSMAKSPAPVEIFKRMSLSPEYICSWLMRRMIFKPLEKSMTVSDMYREYLSTIQFQVNHRPGKRLLRSINLLQEEIAALQQVTTQQRRLISNYTSVLDDTTHDKPTPYRTCMFPHERTLLASITDHLALTTQEHTYLLARCGPLSDSTKQSLEINEEDHGKAILVFTVVTVIFLPLSFVTSYLGMNTTDIRDMGSSSRLFWAVAIPLTALTMGSVMYVGYNGDELRDAIGGLWRRVTGKQDRGSARGISVAQRTHARRAAAAAAARPKTTTTTPTDSDVAQPLDLSSLAHDAEFADPRPDQHPYRTYHHRTGKHPHHTHAPPALIWEPYPTATAIPTDPRAHSTRPYNNNSDDTDDSEDEWYIDEKRKRVTAGLRHEIYHPARYEEYHHTIPTSTRRQRAQSRMRMKMSIDQDIPITPVYSSMPQQRRERRRRRRSHGDEEVRYLPRRQPAARGSGQCGAAGYEWTKQNHRHHRSARDRPRRAIGADDGNSIK